MAIKKVSENLIQITRFGMINCYLLVEDDGVSVVDTGLAGMGDMIIRAATETRLPIKRVLLTHAHGDHTGSLDELADALPDAEFLFTNRSVRLMSGDFGLEPGEPEKPPKGGFPPHTTRPTRAISEGEEIGSLRVYATPGHSPDHVAFVDQRDGTLIAGDSFQTKGGIAVAGVLKWRLPFPALATWDLGLATQSASHLVALAPKRLAPGHGRVLEDPVAAMNRAIAMAQKKLKQ